MSFLSLESWSQFSNGVEGAREGEREGGSEGGREGREWREPCRWGGVLSHALRAAHRLHNINI